jgi:hypothetical protein
MEAFLPTQSLVLDEARELSHGLPLWLKDGPIELGGPFGPFFQSQRVELERVSGGDGKFDFSKDWLKQFLVQWANPVHSEPWSDGSGEMFPYTTRLGLISSGKDNWTLSFERYISLGYAYRACRSLTDIQIVKNELAEVQAMSSQKENFTSAQWVWCLSSEETEFLYRGAEAKNAGGANEHTPLFQKGPVLAQWNWLCFEGESDHGSWSEGLPEYSVVLGDVNLPWVYDNLVVLRRRDSERWQYWIKVPAKAFVKKEERAKWARGVESLMNQKLGLANWRVSGERWFVSPDCPVFETEAPTLRAHKLKNFIWIAPETLTRLDLSARFEHEAKAYRRLIEWRNDELKKQGDKRDYALHAP